MKLINDLLLILAIVVFVFSLALRPTKHPIKANNVYPTVSSLPTPTISSYFVPIETNNTGETITLSRVIDGDTIEIKQSNKVDRVRLIGIDTPELHSKTRDTCFGEEAANHLTELLDDHELKLEFDPVAGERDKYQRLLRYVWVDNQNIGTIMIADGFAREYTYARKEYKYQTQYKQAEAQAKSSQLGLWRYCAGVSTVASPS